MLNAFVLDFFDAAQQWKINWLKNFIKQKQLFMMKNNTYANPFILFHKWNFRYHKAYNWEQTNETLRTNKDSIMKMYWNSEFFR